MQEEDKLGLMDVKSMTPSQRVLAMEALWDSMCHEESEPTSPAWHQRVLEARRKTLAAGEMGFVTLTQLKEHFGA